MVSTRRVDGKSSAIEAVFCLRTRFVRSSAAPPIHHSTNGFGGYKLRLGQESFEAARLSTGFHSKLGVEIYS